MSKDLPPQWQQKKSQRTIEVVIATIIAGFALQFAILIELLIYRAFITLIH